MPRSAASSCVRRAIAIAAVALAGTGAGQVHARAASAGAAEVRAEVQQRLPEIDACYQAELARRPAMAGELVVHFTVTAQGRVSQAAVERSTLASPAVETCVLNALRAWTFSAPAGGREVHAAVPFTFESSPGLRGAIAAEVRPPLLARYVLEGTAVAFSPKTRQLAYNRCWRKQGKEGCAVALTHLDNRRRVQEVGVFRPGEAQDPATRNRKLADAVERVVPLLSGERFLELPRFAWKADSSVTIIPELNLALRWSRGRLRVTGRSLSAPAIHEVPVMRAWRARPIAVYAARDQPVLIVAILHDSGDPDSPGGLATNTSFETIELESALSRR